MKLEARNVSQMHAMRTSPPRCFDKDKNKRQKIDRQRQKETKPNRHKAKIERETNRDNAKRDKETRPRQIETKRTKETNTKKMTKFETRNMSEMHAMRTFPPRCFDKDKNKRQKRD